MAKTLANPIVAPLMIFSGLYIKNSRIPFYFFWLKYCSWMYYAAENLMIGQWAFEDSFYCTLPLDVRLARERAERDVQFAELAQTFHRSNFDCDVSGEDYFMDQKLWRISKLNRTTVKDFESVSL